MAVLTHVKSFLPSRRETILDLVAEGAPWRPERVLLKTGVRERAISGHKESSFDLALQACKRLRDAVPNADFDPDFILFVTQTPAYFLPTTACLLQNALELPQSIGALDLNQGCSGFIYGLAVASALVESGGARCVLLVTADTYSKLLDPNDFGTRSVFGDGATASLVKASGVGHEVKSASFGTDGGGAEKLIVPLGAGANDFSGLPRLFMDGAGIANFGVNVVPEVVSRTLENNGIVASDVDYYVFHQASKFMLDSLQSKLKLSDGQVPRFFSEIGNTVSSTIPIVIEHLMQKEKDFNKKNLLLIGFGVGLSWGGLVLMGQNNEEDLNARLL